MTDNCYNIARKYGGHDTPRWVVRFCHAWVGECATIEKARALAAEHNTNRLEA
jgi:hypothetical protein